MRLFASIFAIVLASTASVRNAVSAQGVKAKGEPAKSYRVLQKIRYRGTAVTTSLYLDDSAKRLYVSHGTEVAVLDATSGAMVGTIRRPGGVHGISVVPGIGKGFITNGKSGWSRSSIPRR